VILRGNVQKRLEEVRDEVRRLREELRVLDEQVTYQQELADEAATKAIVAETPLADRERHSAMEDLRRTRRHRDEVADRLTDLDAEQDELLERLLQ
jgi:cell division septum initiation protein DivIVA